MLINIYGKEKNKQEQKQNIILTKPKTKKENILKKIKRKCWDPSL